jgi:hypothetical protein
MTHGFPIFDKFGKRFSCAVGLEVYLKFFELGQELQDRLSDNGSQGFRKFERK